MYNGGKNGNGVYHTIINQFPPHKVYIELFLGSGAVIKNKKPAEHANIGVEIDKNVLDAWHKEAYYETFNGDYRRFLKIYYPIINSDALVYADPPYLMETRKQNKRLYRNETSRKLHVDLLTWAIKTPAMIVISAYRNPLYDKMLKGWRRIDFVAGTRGGAAIESLYINFPLPEELHEYTYLGKDFIDRQRIRRKIKNKIIQLQNLPRYERNAILEALLQYRQKRL